MKKITLLFLVLFFAVGSSIAQNAEKKWAIGLGPGIYSTLGIDNVGLLGELYLSRYLSPSFDLMLKSEMGFYDYGTDLLFKNDGMDMINPSLNLRYKFNNDKILPARAKVQPYLYGGAGYYIADLFEGVNFNAGVGSKFPISPNTSLYLEAGYFSGVADDRLSTVAPDIGNDYPFNEDFLKLNGIIEFAFGFGKDSDGDGVPDRKDKCPDTPPGVHVDANGCPLDRDGDGVPDYKDECPDQPGLAQFNGCPDTDGDGVPDKDDACPDVPGLARFNGCPDTDGDGVPDNRDRCPNTPRGCPVDANGCPLDSDGDGVIDCEDKCPTVPGLASNQGCPADWEDLVIPTIYFDFDKATLKPEGIAALDKLVEQILASKEYNLVIGGHTCDIGTNNYNMGLSEKRAQAVVKYLLSKGVNNAYVGSNNYGEDKPAVPNTSIDNRKQNRRAEFEVARIRK